MTDKEAVTAVPAATILMLRDGEQGLEVFMVVRHHQIDFASGALVFPGGKVDQGDTKVRDYCSGVDKLDDVALSLQVAAIREAFEECGILLARQVDEDRLISGERLQSLHHYRKLLNKGELSIREFLSSEGLLLACDLLNHFAHWITPAMMPKRFDTHFYLAVAPEDHLAVHDGYESVDSVWITPQQAILDAQAGRKTIIFPTRMNIEMLGLSNSVDDAIRAVEQRNIVTVLPWTEQRDDGTYLCIPAEAGYSVAEELMQSGPA